MPSVGWTSLEALTGTLAEASRRTFLLAYYDAGWWFVAIQRAQVDW